MGQWFQALGNAARYLMVCLLALAALSAPAAYGSPAGPGGINIGLDFNWSFSAPPEPQGFSASFIAAVTPSGATLNNCGGPVNASTVTCNFPIAYDIGGVPQPAAIAGGVYETYPTPPSPPQCDQNPSNSAPLTLWNCFNNDSFGQIFKASATGALSNMTMPMTCLNPAGGTLHGLFAVIYQVNPGGISIPATPLAQVQVDLSTCPTLTSWGGHTFTAGDFAEIPLNFQNVTLTSGNFYAVYFAGPLVPGTQLPGFIPPAPVPALTEWGIFSLALALFGFGAWKLRRRRAAV